MVKHIVFYTLRPDCDKAAAVSQIRTAIEGLVGVVPGLLTAQVRPVYQGGWDYCLYSEFESRQALADYQQHPAHLQVKPIVHSYKVDRASADFDV